MIDLNKLAERSVIFDDETGVVDDFAGGNVDDAYWKGVEDGHTYLARELVLGPEHLLRSNDSPSAQ